VMDFKFLKEIMVEHIHDKLDHGFAVWKDDHEDLDFIIKRNSRVLVTDEPPTVNALPNGRLTRSAPTCLKASSLNSSAGMRHRTIGRNLKATKKNLLSSRSFFVNSGGTFFLHSVIAIIRQFQ